MTPLGAGAPCPGYRNALRLPRGAGGSLETRCPHCAPLRRHSLSEQKRIHLRGLHHLTAICSMPAPRPVRSAVSLAPPRPHRVAAIAQLPGELVGLADLLVEHRRRRVAAQLADAARECPSGYRSLGRMSVAAATIDSAHDRWFVAALDRIGDQDRRWLRGVARRAQAFIDHDGVASKEILVSAGSTSRTRTPCSRTSWSSDSAYPSMACLVAAYKAMHGAGTSPGPS